MIIDKLDGLQVSFSKWWIGKKQQNVTITYKNVYIWRLKRQYNIGIYCCTNVAVSVKAKTQTQSLILPSEKKKKQNYIGTFDLYSYTFR